MKHKAAYPEPRRWRELREACLERAGNQCEFIHVNGQRCARTDGELRRSALSGRKYIVYLHAAHAGNADPEERNPELICLCPAHHLKMDRRLEAQDWVSQRRRGYRITTTDSLLAEIQAAGVEIEEQGDGYRWSLPSLGLGGHATTAARAAGCALYQLRLSLEKHTHASSIAERNQAMTISYRQHEIAQEATIEQNATLSLGNLNELLSTLTGEHLPYLENQLVDWYGQIVPVILLPNGLPALQIALDCPRCDQFSRMVCAVSGEAGAWGTLLEADGSFLADLCDADERLGLICPKCKDHQAQVALAMKVEEVCDGE